MNIKLFLSVTLMISILNSSAQFTNTANNWDIPNIESDIADMNTVLSGNYSIFDINGDGYPDLIDPKDNFSGSIWENGVQRYWKVYLNNGTSISSTAVDWNIPNVESNAMDMTSVGNGFYGLYDMNGDGFPDLVDARDNLTNAVWVNGAQRYWKVYLNNGNAFSATSNQWNLPNVESDVQDMNVISSGYYGLYDMNGDDKLDLVDARDNFTGSVWENGAQRFWKVFINNGSSFNANEVSWNLPNVESNAVDMNLVGNGNFSLIDMNGDQKLDLVDSEDNFTNEVWENGAQRFWKVYENTGTSFNPVSLDWNIPNVESNASDLVTSFTAFYGLYDMNGDGSPDLVDTRDNASGNVWTNGAQRYWKVYLNQGNAFGNEIAWNVPNVESDEADMNVFGNSFYAPIDMNGDGRLDLVDARDNFTSDVWVNGAQRYWKVYGNTSVGFRTIAQALSLNVYPNPSSDKVNIDLSGLKNVKLEVYNSIGKLVYHESKITEDFHIIKLNSFESGIYLIMIESAEGVSTGKLVKE